MSQNFNPRSPDGERRAKGVLGIHSPSNFNPRSPDGERLKTWALFFGH